MFLIIVDIKPNERKNCISHCRCYYPEPNHDPESELAFVQLFKILDSHQLSIDKINRVIGCIILSSQSTSGRLGHLTSVEEYVRTP